MNQRIVTVVRLLTKVSIEIPIESVAETIPIGALESSVVDREITGLVEKREPASESRSQSPRSCPESPAPFLWESSGGGGDFVWP
jgi:hypothetical protein